MASEALAAGQSWVSHSYLEDTLAVACRHAATSNTFLNASQTQLHRDVKYSQELALCYSQSFQLS